jgi:hypothetical protein
MSRACAAVDLVTLDDDGTRIGWQSSLRCRYVGTGSLSD